MTRQEHLKFCKVCTKQKFDAKKGIICGLTSEIANFEGNCENFVKDQELSIKEEQKAEESRLKERVSQGKRFANYLLDTIFALIFGVIMGFILGIVLALISPNLLNTIDFDSTIVNYLFNTVAFFLYYTLFESINGRSLAKYITKTMVVDENGEKPSFGTIMVRSLCRKIPFNAFSFLSSDESGWHDRFSNTRVVDYVKAQPVEYLYK